MDVATFMPLDALALILLDVVLPPAEPPEQNVGEPPTPVAGGVTCEADADPADKEPRLVVPRPLLPRPATPIAAAFGLELGVVLVFPAPDKGDDVEEALPLADVVVREFGELLMPELLTALHEADLGLAPKSPGCCVDGAKLVERVIPPPSKVDGPALP